MCWTDPYLAVFATEWVSWTGGATDLSSDWKYHTGLSEYEKIIITEKNPADSYRNFNDVNWLSLIDSWTITHNLSNDTEVFSVSNGILYYTGNVAVTGQKRYVYPVFYLLSSVAYSSGDGTKDSPIRII